MGIRAVYGDPVPVVRDWVNRVEEQQRRAHTRLRICFYNDDALMILKDQLLTLFDAPEVRDEIERILPMAESNAFAGRVVDDVCRPIYRTPPIRRIAPDSEQEKYRALAREMDLDAQMKTGTRYGFLTNSIYLMPRIVTAPQVEGKKKAQLDVMTGDLVTAIPDPRNPLEALGIAYQSNLIVPGFGPVPVWAVWDDEEYFWFTRDNGIYAQPVKHDLGLLPIVDLHFSPRTGTYHNYTKGRNLISAQMKLTLLEALVIKLHRVQGEQVVYAAGATSNVAQEQTLDGRALLKFEAGPTGTIQVGTLDLTTQPDHYHKTAERTETTTGANHGLSRDRLNQKSNVTEDDDGLRERTEEVAEVVRKGEVRLLEVWKAVSRAHPRFKLSPDAKVKAIDFGSMRYRMDRKTQIEIRKEERRLGYRSAYDDVLEDNPEYETRDEAKEHVQEKMQEESEFVLLRRALNIPENADLENPGQNPEDNGAMGPARRDGLMGKRESDEQASSGASKEQRRAALRKVLKGAAA